MRLYLDNCSFNRPYDNQGQPRIKLEPFDYTKWRESFVNQFEDMSAEELSRFAMATNVV